MFLVAADPSGGVDNPSDTAWIVSFAACFVAAAALMLAARGRSPASRAALLGTAAGVLFALSAALTSAKFDPRWVPRAIAVEDVAAMPKIGLLYPSVEGFLNLPLVGRRLEPNQAPTAPHRGGPGAELEPRPAAG